MPTSIDGYRSKFKSNPARPAWFEVMIIPPPALTATFVKLLGSEGVTYKTSGAQIPGRIIQTQEVRNEPGPLYKVANGSIYNDLSLEIEVTERWREREIFQAWMNTIQNNNDLTGGVVAAASSRASSFISNLTAGQGSVAATAGPHEVKYYDEYASGSVLITAYRADGSAGYRVLYHEAYPISVSPIDLNWATTDSTVRVNIDFAYRYFITTIFN